MRPWRLEIKQHKRWRVFATYTTEQRANQSIRWATKQYWGIEATRVRHR